MSKLKTALYLIAEIVIRMAVVPTLRSKLLRLLGATIGSNVRVYECRFINLQNGFSNLHLGDDVHIGTDCLLDLAGTIRIGVGTTLSPRVMIISHSDPGASHNSPITSRFPPTTGEVNIGDYCWIGAGAIVLSGTQIGTQTVIGAMCLARGQLDPFSVYVGVPARKKI